MIKNKNVAYMLFVVLFVVCWNILDLIYSAVITKTAYQFQSASDLGAPLIMALMIGYLLFLRKNTED